MCKCSAGRCCLRTPLKMTEMKLTPREIHHRLTSALQETPTVATADGKHCCRPRPCGGSRWAQLGRPCHRRVYGAARDPAGGPAGLSWAVHATDVSMVLPATLRGAPAGLSWAVHATDVSMVLPSTLRGVPLGSAGPSMPQTCLWPGVGQVGPRRSGWFTLSLCGCQPVVTEAGGSTPTPRVSGRLQTPRGEPRPPSPPV